MNRVKTATIALIQLMLFISNCTTIIDSHNSIHDNESPRLYGGVRSIVEVSNSPQAAYAGGTIFLFWVDFPFSLVADTILFIPWLIWNGIDQLI